MKLIIHLDSPFPQRSSDTVGPQLKKQFREGNGIKSLPKVEKHNVTWLPRFNGIYNERKRGKQLRQTRAIFRKPNCRFDIRGRMKSIILLYMINSRVLDNIHKREMGL